MNITKTLLIDLALCLTPCALLLVPSAASAQTTSNTSVSTAVVSRDAGQKVSVPTVGKSKSSVVVTTGSSKVSAVLPSASGNRTSVLVPGSSSASVALPLSSGRSASAATTSPASTPVQTGTPAASGSAATPVAASGSTSGSAATPVAASGSTSGYTPTTAVYFDPTPYAVPDASTSTAGAAPATSLPTYTAPAGDQTSYTGQTAATGSTATGSTAAGTSASSYGAGSYGTTGSYGVADPVAIDPYGSALPIYSTSVTSGASGSSSTGAASTSTAIPNYGMIEEQSRIDTIFVHYKLGSTKLDLDFMKNGDEIAALFRYIDSIGARDVKMVNFAGYTSPEGFYGSNIDVSRDRNKSLTAYFKKEYPALEYYLTTSAEGEAWDMLRKDIVDDQALSPESKTKILGIIDGDLDYDAKKKALKRDLGSDPFVGDLYNYISCIYYPMLRCVRVTVQYKPTVE